MSLTKVTRTVVDSISSFFNINNTTGAVTSIVPDLISSNTTLYPSFACRAWVNFDGTVGADVTGTYSQSAFTITVTISNHNYIQGHSVRLTFQNGTASAEIFTVASIVNSNAFTVTSATSRTTSGDCTATRRLIRGGGNIHSVTYNGTGDYSVNFTTAMPDTNYAESIGIGSPSPNVTAASVIAEMRSDGSKTASSIRFTVIIIGSNVKSDEAISLMVFR